LAKRLSRASDQSIPSARADCQLPLKTTASPAVVAKALNILARTFLIPLKGPEIGPPPASATQIYRLLDQASVSCSLGKFTRGVKSALDSAMIKDMNAISRFESVLEAKARTKVSHFVGGFKKVGQIQRLSD
jgi:hypothetical protein